jgi:hypothetical protein
MDPSFGYPEHSNASGNEVLGSVPISPAILTPPNKQTNKQTSTYYISTFNIYSRCSCMSFEPTSGGPKTTASTTESRR